MEPTRAILLSTLVRIGNPGVERQLVLVGGRNFRDLGGYETDDGRRVRYGRIYRSGVLAHLTPDDVQRLDALGIRVVCDFRNAQERRRETIRWTRSDLEVLSCDYDHRDRKSTRLNSSHLVIS